MSGEEGELVTIIGSVMEVDGERRRISFDCCGVTVSQWFLIGEVFPMGFDDEEDSNAAA